MLSVNSVASGNYSSSLTVSLFKFIVFDAA